MDLGEREDEGGMGEIERRGRRERRMEKNLKIDTDLSSQMKS